MQMIEEHTKIKIPTNSEPPNFFKLVKKVVINS